LAALGAELARHGNPHLTGDAITAVLIAEAACRSAVELVGLNLDDAGDDPRRGQAEDLARRAAVARSQALSAVVPTGGAV
jgi:formiminotetrahydrofolate cyclodeaminase